MKTALRTGIALMAATALTVGVAAAGGVVEQHQILGPPSSSGKRFLRDLSVYLPDGYYQTDRRYPTAYLLHGYQGNNTSFLGGTRYGNSFGEPVLPHFSMATEADRLIADGAIPPMIMVFPTIVRNEPSTAVPVSYFASIVAFVDSAYRTLPDRDARIIAGHSLGGRDAMLSALAYPELFSSVGLLAPYFIVSSEPTAATFGGFGGPVPLRFWVYVGANDKHEVWWEGWGVGYYIPPVIREMVSTLAELGIPHAFVEDDSDHNAAVRQRLDDFLAYSKQFLAVQPRVNSAAPESVVVGAVVDWSARVQVPVSESGAPFGRLRADLSGVGGPGVVDLVSEGEGVYRLDPVRLTIPGPTGQRWIPLLSDESSTLAPYSYIRLVVWPDGDRFLFGDGPGAGWTWRTEGSGATLDTAATAITYQGSRALVVQATGPWKVFCEITSPASRVGYDSLRLAVHPGEATPSNWELGLNSNKRRNLLKLVDWADKRWQQVAIPLDSLLEPREAIASIGMQGVLKGSFYLDEVRLTSPPLPSPPTAVLEDYIAALPARFALEQNYPNPFNSETVIRLALPVSGEVELAIYNLAGQKVATLAHGRREVGTYVLRWDGRDDRGQELASGVYLYRLQAGTQMEARKLILLR